MDGFKDTDFFVKAYKMGLVPHSNDTWGMQHDEAAYHDLHGEFPIICNGKPSLEALKGTLAANLNCVAINSKTRKYEYAGSQEDKVQRLCRGMILKNNLSNL